MFSSKTYSGTGASKTVLSAVAVIARARPRRRTNHFCMQALGNVSMAPKEFDNNNNIIIIIIIIIITITII